MRSEFAFIPNASRPSEGYFMLYELHGTEHERVVNKAKRLGFPEGTSSTGQVYGPKSMQIELQDVPCLTFTIQECIPVFLRLSLEPNMQESIVGWGLATRLAYNAIIRQEVVPSLVLDEERNMAQAVWTISEDETLQDAIEGIANCMPYSALAVPSPDPDSMYPPETLVRSYVNAVVDVTLRQCGPAPTSSNRERILPWTARWQEGLNDQTNPDVPLKGQTSELVAAVEGWQERLEHDDTVVLELEAPETADGQWIVRAQVASEDNTLIPATQVWASADPVRIDMLLAGLSRASRVFQPLDELLNGEHKDSIVITLDQAWELIVEATPRLKGAGIDVTLPTNLAEDAMVATIELTTQDDNTILATWGITLDSDSLTDEELASMQSPDDNLIFAQGKWIRLDDAARSALQSRGRTEVISKTDALAMSLSGSISDEWFGAGTSAAHIHYDAQLASVIDAIKGAGDLEQLQETPEGFIGELRDYQRRGVAWLRGMTEMGLGAVLADSMGLGKTIQLIALLVSRPGPFLVVCPTSVVGNWEREIQRFSPDLPVRRHHGPEREPELGEVEGVIITSYGTLRRDIEILKTVEWDIVTLDEAQQVKNPSTSAAKAVRDLTANSVIALTGTPLENRLSELWAVIDVTNNGLLGSHNSFKKRFVRPIEISRDPMKAQRLQRLIAPFVMRRTKDDPEIASNLPEKIFRNVYCTLTREQAKLYEQVTKESMKNLAHTQGMHRRGEILKMITNLKKITNHPAQYLKESGPLVGRSGKLQALQEIIASAIDAEESTLIFTQYTEMGELLVKQLSQDLDIEVPFFKGSLTLPKRDQIVENFQTGTNPGVLVLSTRAGGTGLNLTAATHVVHYDRWWNPAVEDQATDRAHRIGQTKTVEVHNLIVSGTFEDRIAEMLERKRELADIVVAGNESWVTELDQEALEDLVSLGANAQIHDSADAPAIYAITKETL